VRVKLKKRVVLKKLLFIKHPTAFFYLSIIVFKFQAYHNILLRKKVTDYF